jgi:hypothetical protein
MEGMMRSMLRRQQGIIGAVALSVALGAFGTSQGASPEKTVFSFGICIALILAIGALQGRSEAATVFAGNAADERQRMIHFRAIEFAGEVTIALSIGGYVVVELMHGDTTGFAVIAAGFGFAYVAAVLWLRSRV